MIKLEEVEDNKKYSVVPKGKVRNTFMTGKDIKDKVSAGLLEIKYLGIEPNFCRYADYKKAF